MPHDDIDNIPAIVPTRDSEHLRPTANGGARKNKDARLRSTAVKSGGSAMGGMLARMVITIALVVAAVACAWAWQLQLALKESDLRGEDYARRIGDLEARLSDTDQGMNQNAELQAAKIRELDSEVRKLWDNVWKQARERLGKLEKGADGLGKKIDAATAGLATAQGQIKSVNSEITSARGDIAKLNSVAGELERIIASGKANQAEVERVADTINRVNLDIAKLSKRVQGNEEWIQSINAFRKQVNASLVELQAAVRAQP